MKAKHLSQTLKKTRQKNRYKKVVEFKDLNTLSKKLKKQGKKIIFTCGSFDLLNPGHCRYLAEAKSLGDTLIVGVTTDQSEKFAKGEEFPIVNQHIRGELISYLKSVDYITYVDEKHVHGVLAVLQPDIFFTNERDWELNVRDDQELFILKMYGGKVHKHPIYKPYYGTNDLVDHIANIRVVKTLEGYLRERLGEFDLNPEKHLQPADFGNQKPAFKSAFDPNKLIVNFNELADLGEKLRQEGKTITFVSGSYDLLHVGHARFIEQAGMQTDVLVVGIPSDTSLRKLKGVGRPVISEISRAYVLGHLDPVDYVVIFDDSSVLNSLQQLKPNIFFTVLEDWNKGYKKSPEYKVVKSYGGRVVTSKRQAPFLSASALIDKMALKKVKEIFKECMDEEKIKAILEEESRLKR